MKRKLLLLALTFLLLFSSIACACCSGFNVLGLTDDQRSGEGNSALGLDSTHRGSIPVGGQVRDRLDSLTLAHDWTFEGRAGQSVTIRCEAAPGEDTDPRVNLLGPGGEWLIADDDGGADFNALISNYRLPSDGTYTIKVDIFTGGEYILILQ